MLSPSLENIDWEHYINNTPNFSKIDTDIVVKSKLYAKDENLNSSEAISLHVFPENYKPNKFKYLVGNIGKYDIIMTWDQLYSTIPDLKKVNWSSYVNNVPTYQKINPDNINYQDQQPQIAQAPTFLPLMDDVIPGINTKEIIPSFLGTEFESINQNKGIQYPYDDMWVYEWSEIYNPVNPQKVFLTFWIRTKDRSLSNKDVCFLLIDLNTNLTPKMFLDGSLDMKSYGKASAGQFLGLILDRETKKIFQNNESKLKTEHDYRLSVMGGGISSDILGLKLTLKGVNDIFMSWDQFFKFIPNSEDVDMTKQINNIPNFTNIDPELIINKRLLDSRSESVNLEKITLFVAPKDMKIDNFEDVLAKDQGNMIYMTWDQFFQLFPKSRDFNWSILVNNIPTHRVETALENAYGVGSGHDLITGFAPIGNGSIEKHLGTTWASLVKTNAPEVPYDSNFCFNWIEVFKEDSPEHKYYTFWIHPKIKLPSHESVGFLLIDQVSGSTPEFMLDESMGLETLGKKMMPRLLQLLMDMKVVAQWTSIKN